MLIRKKVPESFLLGIIVKTTGDSHQGPPPTQNTSPIDDDQGFQSFCLCLVTKLGDEKETPCILIYTSSGFFFHLPPQVHVVTIIHPANSYSLVNLF